MKRFRTIAAGITSLLAVSFATAQTLVVIASPISHKVLTIDSTSTAQYVPVVQADYVNTPNQRWTLHLAGSGKYYIYNTADGRALEATTTAENTPLYATGLKYDDLHQMWRFGPGHGPGDRAITSAFNGLTLTPDWNNVEVENAPVLQTRSGNVLNNWFVIPVNSVPNCRGVTAAVNNSSTVLSVAFSRVRNAIKVGVWIYPQDSGRGAPVWFETEFYDVSDSWNLVVDTYPALPSGDTFYSIDGYAIGADNQWHYIGSSSVMVGPRVQPPRPELPN